VAVLVSPAFRGKIDVWRRDSEGRVISLLVPCGRNKINFINIYIPTNLADRKTFFENLHRYFISVDSISLGDFNCYEYVLDKFGGNSSPAKYLSDFRSSFNLVDIFHKLHPRACDVSWFNSDRSIGTHLDKFLLLFLSIPFSLLCFLRVVFLIMIRLICVLFSMIMPSGVQAYGNLVIPFCLTIPFEILFLI